MNLKKLTRKIVMKHKKALKALSDYDKYGVPEKLRGGVKELIRRNK